jgi:hypothetical protein
MSEILDEDRLAQEAADAARWLRAKPGDHYVRILCGSRSEDRLSDSISESEEEFRIHLDEEPPPTDPDA